VICSILSRLFNRLEHDQALVAAQRWIEKLPRHDSRISLDEVMLMKSRGQLRLLEPYLRHVTRRFVAEIQELLHSLPIFPDEEPTDRKEKKARLSALGELLACLAGYSTDDLDVTSQLHDMFDAVQEYRSGEERHWDLDRALLEPFKDMTFKIVDGVAAEFYSELSVERSSIHTRRDALGGLDDMLLVAASIQGQHAALGGNLARKAFEEATRRMSEPSPNADVMQRVVETVAEVLSLSIQNKSVAERDAIDFVEAAVHWAWTSKDSTVAAVLSDLGDRSHDEAVAQVLRAGAASVALATGRAELAQKHIERVTPNALSEAHFFGYFGRNTPDLPTARILLGEILCRARIGSECFADALSQLFELGVRERPPMEAAGRLELIEEFLVGAV
jgi:hypothetical protein